jgi:hypothetical protein
MRDHLDQLVPADAVIESLLHGWNNNGWNKNSGNNNDHAERLEGTVLLPSQKRPVSETIGLLRTPK